MVGSGQKVDVEKNGAEKGRELLFLTGLYHRRPRNGNMNYTSTGMWFYLSITTTTVYKTEK